MKVKYLLIQCRVYPIRSKSFVSIIYYPYREWGLEDYGFTPKENVLGSVLKDSPCVSISTNLTLLQCF